MRKIILVMLAVFALSGFLSVVFAKPAAAATVQLCNTSGETAQQCLVEIQNINSNLSGDYALNMDVVLPATSLTAFTPIGTVATPFTGTFDGQDHVIANLQITDTGANTGLFGVSTGTIENLSLFNVNSNNTAGNAGALVGANKRGVIEDITLKEITINSAGNNVGGLVGLNDTGSITGCHAVSAVNVTGIDQVGGLVGMNKKTLGLGINTGIFSSSANVTVTGEQDVGGLLGGSLSSEDMFVDQSYSEGQVTSTKVNVFDGTGGLVGTNDDNQDITNCYSRATVNGKNRVGGLVGLNDGVIEKAYSTGAVAGLTSVGGLVGEGSTGLVKQYSYWDTQTSGQATSAGGAYAIGKTTAQMKQQSTYSGWDFTNIWHIISGDYPVLAVHTKEVTLSGIAYLDQGTTPVPVGTVVKLYVNGPQVVLKQSTLTTTGGAFSFDIDSDELTSGQTLLLYMVDPTHEGNAVFVPNNNISDVSGINILANRVYVYSSTPITSATFTTAKGTLTNDILFDICSCGQVDFNVSQLDLDSTGNVNIGGLIGSATDRMAIAKLVYLNNLPIPSGKLQMMNSIDLSTVAHPASP